MIVLTRRQEKLVRFLENENSIFPINYLAKKLKASERTVYSEISNLKKMGFIIKSVQGKGIFLENKDFVAKNALKVFYDNIHLRRIEIIHSLLIRKEVTTLKALSEKYYVSNTSIKKDLEFISNLLSNDSKIRLISDRRGTRIDETDFDRRVRFLSNFNSYIIEANSKRDAINYISCIDILKQYYGEDIVDICKKVMYKFLIKNIKHVQEVYIDNFFSRYIAVVKEISDGNHFNKNNVEEKIEKKTFFMTSALKLIHEASILPGFEYTDEDVSYLSQILVNYRFEENPGDIVDDEIVKKLIKKVSDVLNVDFNKDETLFEQLKAHISAMIGRLRAKVPVNNPFTDQIKKEFALTYNVLWVVMSEIGNELNIVFNEDEIAFLTIYFQIPIENKLVKKKFLIVCQSGMVTSEFLINRIKKIVPSIYDIEVTSVFQLDKIDITSYDLILTTIKTDITADNLKHISPFISNEELNSILSKTGLKNSLKNNISTDGEIEYFIFTEQNFSSKEDLLSGISSFLFDKGYVDSCFFESLMHREQVGSTESINGVAIPHGNPSNVLKSSITLIKNKTKIKWNEVGLDIIFIISIAQDDIMLSREIISNIFNIISEVDILKRLKASNNHIELRGILNGK